MDIERITHRNYTFSVMIAIVLSVMLVVVASLVGRSALNFRGALDLHDPTDVTVIAAVEPRLQEHTSITSIEFLRKEVVAPEVNEKPYYAYLVKTSDSTEHLVRIAWEKEKRAWTLLTFEALHVDR